MHPATGPQPATARPAPASAGAEAPEDRAAGDLVPETLLPDDLLATFRERAAGYDRENRFFDEDFADLVRIGYPLMLVPRDRGGLGFTLQQAVAGSLSRSTRNRRPRHAEIDWHRTIRANLRHYQPRYRTIVPERRIFFCSCMMP